MSLSNTSASFGSITKTFHWLTMLLIFTVIPLGIIAHDMPFDTSEALARKAWLFSLHKTVGVTIFFVAVLRILWAISQPKPGLLHADRKVESWLAETVHWTLYASLILVPLAGWVHHAATTGFAPIWWPFGQSLPFVPKDETVASVAGGLHIVFERVLIISILLHVVGALKHHFVDKDSTLRRMLPGLNEPEAVTPHHVRAAPIMTAIAAYVVAMGVGSALGLYGHGSTASEIAALEDVNSGWQVQEGTLGITVDQFGSDVAGEFAEWTAAIEFTENSDNDVHGSVDVQIAIGSLTLGSVTDQAMGADFFDNTGFPTAAFTAKLVKADTGWEAQGNLTLKGTTVPVTLPFELTIADGIATMSGTTQLNRTSFAIGESYPDESSLGFGVDVSVSLTAVQN